MPGFTCKLGTGTLGGTWREHFTTVSGNCGVVPDNTVNVDSPAPAGCTFTTRNFSTDRCHADIDFTCPTPDNVGSVRFVGAFPQQSDTLVTGSGTFTVNDPGVGTCLGTYDITLTKI